MIILDTNVVSALMRSPADPPVVEWLDRHPVESLWLTSINVYEIRFGLAILPKGRRRTALEAAFQAFLELDLENRVLDFDRLAAEATAELSAERHRGGRPIDMRDAQIAGIALVRRATLATRNTRHFADARIPLADPWNGHS